MLVAGSMAADEPVTIVPASAGLWLILFAWRAPSAGVDVPSGRGGRALSTADDPLRLAHFWAGVLVWEMADDTHDDIALVTKRGQQSGGSYFLELGVGFPLSDGRSRSVGTGQSRVWSG